MTTVGGMYGGYGYGNVGVVGAQQTTIGVVGGTTLGGYGVSTMPSTVVAMPSTLGGYGTLGGVSNFDSYNGGVVGAQQTTLLGSTGSGFDLGSLNGEWSSGDWNTVSTMPSF